MVTQIATSTASAASARPPFPLEKLPTELRLRIYKLALQGILNYLRSRNFVGLFLSRDGLAKYRGALALCHTSRSIRAESVRELLSVLETKLAKATGYLIKLEQTKSQKPRSMCYEHMRL